MSTIQKRRELHDYIEQADDRVIKLIYGMLTADRGEDEYELTDEHKKILDERFKSYRSNPLDVLTWDEVKANLPRTL